MATPVCPMGYRTFEGAKSRIPGVPERNATFILFGGKLFIGFKIRRPNENENGALERSLPSLGINKA